MRKICKIMNRKFFLYIYGLMPIITFIANSTLKKRSIYLFRLRYCVCHFYAAVVLVL